MAPRSGSQAILTNDRRPPTLENMSERRSISYTAKRGWLLAHNSVRPAAVNTRHGENGFRQFWVSPPGDGWSICQCGWRPDLGPHYARPAE